MKLNIGCGDTRKEGFEGIDYVKLPTVDHIWNLNDIPWQINGGKIDDNSVDEIFCSHNLEHLDKPVAVMKEIHRILKPNGKTTIIVPHIQGILAPSGMHKSYFGVIWFYSWVNPMRRIQENEFEYEYCRQQFRGGCKLRMLSRTMYPKREYPWAVSLAFGAVSLILKPLEWIINSHHVMQFAWEKFGFIRPDEIEWVGYKLYPDIPDVSDRIFKGAAGCYVGSCPHWPEVNP